MVLEIVWNTNQIVQNVSGGVGGMGVFEECTVSEEFAFGCTGIATVFTSSNLGVS